MIYSVYYANCENWCNEKIRHENDNCIVAYTYLLKNKQMSKKSACFVCTYIGMSDSKRNRQLGFIQNILQQQRVIYPFGYWSINVKCN